MSRKEKDTMDRKCNCPGKHGLKRFYKPHSSFYCDICEQQPWNRHGAMIKGQVAYGCRVCNYDACENCYEKCNLSDISE